MEDQENQPPDHNVLDYARPAGVDNRPLKWAMIVFVGVLSAMAVFLLASSRHHRSGYSYRVKCAANLRTIGIGLRLYCNDNRGQYPPRLDLLFVNSDLASDCFVCPESSDDRATGPTTQQLIADFNKPGHLSYVYLGAGWNEKNVTSAMIVAHEKSVIKHDGAVGMNVLYCDGHVQWLNAKESAYLLKELAAGFNPPRPPATAPSNQ